MVETNVHVRVNTLALRGPELAEKQPNEIRLMTLGDSSVFGFGVEEADVFGAVAASYLSSEWARPVVPVNGGTPGYTSVQALHTLQDVGRHARPRHPLCSVHCPRQRLRVRTKLPPIHLQEIGFRSQRKSRLWSVRNLSLQAPGNFLAKPQLARITQVPFD